MWSLPPTLREGDKDRAKYSAIGESDRMTLKFVKVSLPKPKAETKPAAGPCSRGACDRSRRCRREGHSSAAPAKATPAAAPAAKATPAAAPAAKGHARAGSCRRCAHYGPREPRRSEGRGSRSGSDDAQGRGSGSRSRGTEAPGSAAK